jgi:exopolyphosphatase
MHRLIGGLFLIYRSYSCSATSMASRAMTQFLHGSKSNLLPTNFDADHARGATFVLGNEAADADSIISSLTYAKLKQWETGNSVRKPIFPIVSIKRDDIHLRRDIELLLREIDLTLSDLICLDECNMANFANECNLDLVLVDHNILSKEVSKQLGPSARHESMVTEIFDHHEDCDAYKTAVVRDIAYDSNTKSPLVASTCTLIAERFLQPLNRDALTLDIATLLIAVIAVDSLNMDPSQKRGTPRDRIALESLQLLYPAVQRDRLYNLLMNAKTDPLFWESLSARDAIRIDFKSFVYGTKSADTSKDPVQSERCGSFGIASVLQSVDSFLMKKDLNDELSSYLIPTIASASSLQVPVPVSVLADMLVIMSLELLPEVRRSLLFFCTSESRIKRLSSYLAIKGTDILLEDRSNIPGVPSVRTVNGQNVYMLAYNQGNTAMSRKQIAPILLDFYSSEIS